MYLNLVGLRFIIFYVLAINISVQALFDDDKKEILAFMLPHITECAKEYPIIDGAVETVLESGNFDSVNSCFMACVAKKIELMDEKGLVNKEKVIELSEKLLSEENRKPLPDAISSCEGVNEKEVSDGEKGCDRVDHLLKCTAPFLATLFA